MKSTGEDNELEYFWLRIWRNPSEQVVQAWGHPFDLINPARAENLLSRTIRKAVGLLWSKSPPGQIKLDRQFRSNFQGFINKFERVSPAWSQACSKLSVFLPN
jgi:hypothetical protein